MATLKASRVLGKIAPERIPDFGFDKTDLGTLKVTVGGKEHTLAFGEKTPGGTDRYVRDTATGEAYVIAGLIGNDLTAADGEGAYRFIASDDPQQFLTLGRRFLGSAIERVEVRTFG